MGGVKLAVKFAELYIIVVVNLSASAYRRKVMRTPNMEGISYRTPILKGISKWLLEGKGRGGGAIGCISVRSGDRNIWEKSYWADGTKEPDTCQKGSQNVILYTWESLSSPRLLGLLGQNDLAGNIGQGIWVSSQEIIWDRYSENRKKLIGDWERALRIIMKNMALNENNS